MNIVSTIMQLLAPAIINKIASSLGVNQGIAGKAIAAIVPAILAGLVGKSSTSSGAADLASALGKQDSSILGNLGSLIGGPGQQSYADKGNSVLGSLLGGSASSALAGAAGKFAGLGGSQSSSLLGMLAPVVLGGLAQQQKSSNLDAGGLANLLAGQKDNIKSAMPAGFSDLLAGSGLLDSLSAPAKKVSSAPSMMPSAPSAVADGNPLLKYALPAALVAIAGYYILGSGTGPVVVEKPAMPSSSSSTASPAGLPGAEMPAQVTKILDGLKGTLTGVTDEASAKTALPKLQDMLAQLDKTKTTAAALPAEARHPLVVMISGIMPGVADMITKALAIPGVSGVLKPVLDQISASLTGMTK
jgi:Bacterial protein of unknown function (DUF937)